MKNAKLKSALLAAVLLAAALFAINGCTPVETMQRELNAARFTPQNNIISYKPIDLDKQIIVCEEHGTFDISQLETAVEAKFPDTDIVVVQSSAGTNQGDYLKLMTVNQAVGDMLFTTTSFPADFSSEYYCDMSAYEFVTRYSLAALQKSSTNGRLYQLPITSSCFGIFYNKTLFDEHGWSVPENLDEFYALCDKIAAEGIRPFVPCYKYETTVFMTSLGLTYEEMISTKEKYIDFFKCIEGDLPCGDVLEPMFENVRLLYKKGYITDDDFSSSATQNRKALYNGEIAMIPYDNMFYTFYQDEAPDCEIGFFGYPTSKNGQRYLIMQSGFGVIIPQAAVKNEKKRARIIDILDFISTGEGQDALLGSTLGISNLRNYQSQLFSGIDEIGSCMSKGTVFFFDQNGVGEAQKILLYAKGELDWDELSKNMGSSLKKKSAKDDIESSAEPIGTAQKDFTLLETSFFNADAMREASGADIALMPHAVFNKGNLAQLFKGNITIPEVFVLKAIKKDDFLTVYEITGANLKALLEHPIIDGSEGNFLYAFSGLKLEYAPWASADANVISVMRGDGTPIDDEKTYTVAAWATSIDDRYISAVARELPEAGMNMDVVTAAIQRGSPIAPADDSRIKLDWSVR